MKLYGKITEIVPELMKLDMDKLYTCEIKEPKSKRSLEQNKLLWKLVHSIAKETYQDDIEIYCTALERADASSDYVITATDMEDTLRKQFRGVKFIRKQEVNDKECNVYKVYLGSSKMNVKEMNELLEIVFQMCSELGIPTMEDLYE
jgi:hypothetical protein